MMHGLLILIVNTFCILNLMLLFKENWSLSLHALILFVNAYLPYDARHAIIEIFKVVIRYKLFTYQSLN